MNFFMNRRHGILNASPQDRQRINKYIEDLSKYINEYTLAIQEIDSRDLRYTAPEIIIQYQHEKEHLQRCMDDLQMRKSILNNILDFHRVTGKDLEFLKQSAVFARDPYISELKPVEQAEDDIKVETRNSI